MASWIAEVKDTMGKWKFDGKAGAIFVNTHTANLPLTSH